MNKSKVIVMQVTHNPIRHGAYVIARRGNGEPRRYELNTWARCERVDELVRNGNWRVSTVIDPTIGIDVFIRPRKERK